MSCNSCSSEFGILKREVGCDICGFSFCSRCCKKQEVPSKTKGTVNQRICRKCYDNLFKTQHENKKASPPLAYKNRMAALKKQSVSVDSGCGSSNEKDKEIAERLQKLKRDKINDIVPSEDDIVERLAKLKGMDPAKFKAPPIQVYRPPNFQTSVKDAADLMKQIALEVELDSRLAKPEDEISARLARLRDEDPTSKKASKNPNSEIDLFNYQASEVPSEEMDIDKTNLQFIKQNESMSSAAYQDLSKLINDPKYKALQQNITKVKEEEKCDDEEEANKLIEQLLVAKDDEDELDSLDDDIEENSRSDKDITEEFPWCVICTENAKIRCLDCDSDIYCLNCFRECHDSLDIKDHKTCPYLPPKTPTF